MIKIKRGLDIPISGTPEQKIYDAAAVQSVALLGRDYHGRKRLPTVLVEEGDRVKLGQPLVRGKVFANVAATAPGSGIVTRIERGERRFLQTIEILLEGDDEESFNRYSTNELPHLNREQVRDGLLASGLWRSFRTRPYSQTADPENEPDAIFVTAIDSNPLAADPQVIINESPDDFANGLTVISALTTGKVYVCTAPGATLGSGNAASVVTEEFADPHPAPEDCE